MKCPVCKLSSGVFYKQPTHISDKDFSLIKAGILDPIKIAVPEEMPLYQRSYPGEKEYISPRCSQCFDRRLKKWSENR